MKNKTNILSAFVFFDSKLKFYRQVDYFQFGCTQFSIDLSGGQTNKDAAKNRNASESRLTTSFPCVFCLFSKYISTEFPYCIGQFSNCMSVGFPCVFCLFYQQRMSPLMYQQWSHDHHMTVIHIKNWCFLRNLIK